MLFLRAVNVRPRVFHFIVCWIIGLLTGTFLATVADVDIGALMRMAILGHVSIVLLYAVAFLPFLITAFAVYIRKFDIAFLLAFVNAVAYGLLGQFVGITFGSASWLMLPMFLFSRIILCTLYCWFMIRCILANGVNRMDFVICVLVCFLAVIMDVSLVSPFLASLM